MWPKTQQVLEVLRDQGLFLSLLLGLSAFFSMAETSITTLWPWKVRELAKKEGEGGFFQVLRQDVTRFLTTILIGTMVVNIAGTALVTEAATTLFGEAGVTAATGVMTVVLLLVTEIALKSIAVHNATEVAHVVVRPIAWLSVILYPVGRLVTTMSTSLLKLLGLKSSGEPFVSEDELKLMLQGDELSGTIEEEEQLWTTLLPTRNAAKEWVKRYTLIKETGGHPKQEQVDELHDRLEVQFPVVRPESRGPSKQAPRKATKKGVTPPKDEPSRKWQLRLTDYKAQANKK